MVWVNASLLLGAALAAVPVVLHLALRPRPKRILFPALRFVKQRRETNQRTLRLRHWILLALRCLAILAMAMLFARPSTHEAAAAAWGVAAMVGLAAVVLGVVAVGAWMLGRGPAWVIGAAALATACGLTATWLGWKAVRDPAQALLGPREAPVSALLVVDVSPRMGYVLANQTRLERAQEILQWLVEQLPANSEAAVLDSRSQPAAFSSDLPMAQDLARRLTLTGAPRPLSETIRQAVQLLDAAQHERRELYVFTDLTQPAWADARQSEAVRQLLQQRSDLALYVIDVGAESPVNRGLRPLVLSSETIPQGGSLALQTAVEAQGFQGDVTVELWIDTHDPTRPILQDNLVQRPASQKRGEQLVSLSGPRPAEVRFQLQGLEPGVRQGRVRIVGADGLSVDDERYFAVEVGRAQPVLLVRPASVDASFVKQAIAPDEYQEFECTVVDQSSWGNWRLEDFAAVFLLDPAPLTPEQWTSLNDYVQAGGGLAVILGRHAEPPASFNEPVAQQLLGGLLARQWRSPDRQWFLTPESTAHPLLTPFRELQSSTPWDRFSVFKNWQVEPLAGDAVVVFRLANNGQPAVIERLVGEGRVITMTTPLTDISPRQNPWNEFVYGDNNWPPFLLVDQFVQHLTRGRQSQLNFILGQDVHLANDEQEYPRQYQMFTPEDRMVPVDGRQGRIELRSLEAPGPYYLKGSQGRVVVRGFAENLDPGAGDLRRLEPQQLDEALGEGRYQLARDQEEIDRVQDRQRVGREFFPYLLLLVVALFGLEHLLSNRFYRIAPRGAPRTIDSPSELRRSA